MAQVVETTIANNVTGMGEISKLINKVGELDQEQKRLAAAMLQVKGAGDKLTKSTNNVASATRAQASAANELRNRLDPMFAAQKRFNQQMDEADRLYEAGVISLKEYTAAQKQARDALRQHAQAVQTGNENNQNNINKLDATSKALRRQRQGLQQVGMQVNDFATSVSTGASITTAFNQQIGQLGYALSIMGDAQGEATTKFQKFGQFLAGPWGAALTIASMLIGQMAEGMFEAEDATVDLEKGMDFAAMSAGQLTEATKLLKEANEDYQKEARQSLTQTLALTKSHYESAKGRLADAKAALMQRMANRTTIGTDPAATASLSNTSAALAHLQSRIEGANSSLAEAEGRFLGATADMMRYVATTDSATRAQDELTESINLATAMIADGTLSVSEGRQQIAALAEAQERLKDAARGSGDAIRDNSAATQEHQTELQKFLKSQESYIQSLKDAINPAGVIQREIDTLNRIFGAGALPLDAYNARLKILQERLDALQPADVKKDIDAFFAGERLRGMQLEFQPLSPELQKIIEKQDPYANIKARNEELLKSYEAIGNAVANGFKGMITGAQSFGSAMKGIIQSVIDELFRLYVVQQIVGFVTGALSGAFGGGAQSTGSTGRIGGFRALGGSVSANTPYVVGEKGPELFMPSKSGTIIPNQNMPNSGGGGMVINVDARGSSDPEAVRQQVQQGILEAAPSIVAAAQNRTINTLRRPRLAGAL